MATMITTAMRQEIVAMGLRALRENIVLANLATREYENEMRSAKRGDTVKVTVPAAVPVSDVTPSVVSSGAPANAPTTVPIVVDQHKKANFAMTDKDIVQIQNDIIPGTLSEAVRSLANEIDSYLWGKFTDRVYGYYETGATPFSNDKLTDYIKTRTIANQQLMPMDNRFMVIDPTTEGAALDVRAIQDASWRGDDTPIRNGTIGQIGGAMWAMSQNVPTHTAGDGAAYVTSGAGAVGDKSVALVTGTGTVLVGDIVTFAGHAQTYVVTAGVAAPGTISIEPGLQVIVPDATAMSIEASHIVNGLMHRTCVAFAMAPLEDSVVTQAQANRTTVAIDEQSGLALRLTLEDQHFQTEWILDALYGGNVIRPQLGVRMAVPV